ncbi:fungal-specific transcription factor domain-containing protein [Paraphoma chrysanthemicola]|nr:fungal-specific transcription factor domain-containing protein [Paraphoma chrysanthemicola]
MGVKGCWTCRERKVRCDARKPTCGNCTKAKRECRGYGMQLSWPKAEDNRRSFVLRGANVRQQLQRGVIADPEQARFVNVRSWDVALALAMVPEDGMARGRDSRIARHMRFMSASTSTQLPYPTYLPPTTMNKEESCLLEFFTESTSLMLGPTDAETLAHFILQVALSGPESSNTTNTVLQAVFALSSLQLYGSGSTSAFRYKKRVVAEIANAATDWLDETALLRNLVATMLLYHCEVGSVESSRRGTWVTFFCAVKRIIHTSPVMNKLIRPEYSVFLDWIYYHEALSEFAIRHWKVPYAGCGFAPMVRSAGAVDGTKQHADEGNSSSNDVLELLVHACRQAIVAPCPEMGYTAVESERATVLEHHISMAVGDFGPIPESLAGPKNRHSMVSDLHRVACLIYVNRAVHRVSATDFRHRRLVREGILLMQGLDACPSAWPLFIIGCEAIDDEQRLVVLNVCERIRRDPRQRSCHVDSTQRLVEAVWNQLDLDEEGQVKYTAILDAVIGGLPFMPLLA